MSYAIIRFYHDEDRREREVLQRSVSLDEARAWCRDKNTRSDTATSEKAQAWTARHGDWFDGYDHTKGAHWIKDAPVEASEVCG